MSMQNTLSCAARTTRGETISTQNQAHYQVCRSNEGQYYFFLVVDDGRILLRGEEYPSKDHCLNAIKATMGNVRHEESYERVVREDGQRYFMLIAPDPATLATSPRFSSRLNLEHAVLMTMRVGPGAPVVDLTKTPSPPTPSP